LSFIKRKTPHFEDELKKGKTIEILIMSEMEIVGAQATAD